MKDRPRYAAQSELLLDNKTFQWWTVDYGSTPETRAMNIAEIVDGPWPHKRPAADLARKLNKEENVSKLNPDGD